MSPSGVHTLCSLLPHGTRVGKYDQNSDQIGSMELQRLGPKKTMISISCSSLLPTPTPNSEGRQVPHHEGPWERPCSREQKPLADSQQGAEPSNNHMSELKSEFSSPTELWDDRSHGQQLEYDLVRDPEPETSS